MASITVRNLDENVKKRLRRQAAEHGRSLEAEVRDILGRNVSAPPRPPAKTGLDLFRDIRAVVDKFGGFELEIPKRTPMRKLPFAEDDSPRSRKK